MIATRFAVATHILLYLAAGPGEGTITSLRLARSVNTNPVVVRRIAGQLARAGLVLIRRGPGGAALAREPQAITLEDVWLAVNTNDRLTLLPVHRNPDPECPVGGVVRLLLLEAFGGAERALHERLAQMTLASLAGRLPGR
jgi:DNA-binding IscR family transcriptional regulator